MLLTLITQVGGVLYLIAIFLYKVVKIESRSLKVIVVIVTYMLGSFAIVPNLAKKNNRVQLDYFKSNNMGPHTLFTVLANRHYVRPELKALYEDVSIKVNEKYPTAKIEYLDASFPLFEQRLLPHLKHDDGKKLDICFIWKKQNSNKYTTQYQSFFGYGFSEKPLAGEQDSPAYCKSKGFKQYNITAQLVPNQKWRKLEFALAENKLLVKEILAHKSCRYIFIEPHLRARMKFENNPKARFHGCWAVRHDDHIHIQMK